jgi:hypothetical protein
LLQDWNRFCPVCFEDQFAPVGAGDARPPIEPRHGTAAANESLAPVAIDFTDTVQPDAQDIILIPGPTGAADVEADPEIGLVRPGFWHTEMPEGDGKAPRAARLATTQRVAIGIASALVLAGLAFLGLKVLTADQAEEPGVQASKAPVDTRVQEQAAKREQLLDAPLKTSRTLRLDEAAAPPPSVPPEAPGAAGSAPATGTPAAQQKACSEALAALALCQQK